MPLEKKGKTKVGQTLATRASSLPPSLPEPLGVQPIGSPIIMIVDQDDHDDDDMLCGQLKVMVMVGN